MIKLFRNIRQKLLAEGKTSNYLKYAIGEIVLVVIGILIALQVNNWNEDRKSKIIQDAYLNDLMQELNTNMKDYKHNIDEYDIRLSKFDAFFSVVNNDNATADDIKKAGDSVIKYVGVIYIKTDVIEEFKRSGHFSQLNKEIKDRLIAFYGNLSNDLERIQNDLNESLKLRSEWYSAIDYAFYKGKLKKESSLVKGWETDKNSIEFMKSTNFFMFRYEMIERTREIFKQQIHLSQDLINELKTYLDK